MKVLYLARDKDLPGLLLTAHPTNYDLVEDLLSMNFILLFCKLQKQDQKKTPLISLIAFGII